MPREYYFVDPLSIMACTVPCRKLRMDPSTKGDDGRVQEALCRRYCRPKHPTSTTQCTGARNNVQDLQASWFSKNYQHRCYQQRRSPTKMIVSMNSIIRFAPATPTRGRTSSIEGCKYATPISFSKLLLFLVVSLGAAGATLSSYERSKVR